MHSHTHTYTHTHKHTNTYSQAQTSNHTHTNTCTHTHTHTHTCTHTYTHTHTHTHTHSFLQRLFSAPGSLLRFLAMIWTVPVGIELGLPSSMSNSSSLDLSAMGISVVLQACSLAIAGAYLKSIPIPAKVALVGVQCPGIVASHYLGFTKYACS